MSRSFCPDCYREVASAGRCHICEFHEHRHRFMMVLVVVIALIALCQSCNGSVVTEEFLDRIAQRESGGKNSAIGKRGERGAYQIRQIALKDVNECFGWKVQHKEVHNAQVGRSVARAYLVVCERRLTLLLRRQPTQQELYRAYNRGVKGSLK